MLTAEWSIDLHRQSWQKSQKRKKVWFLPKAGIVRGGDLGATAGGVGREAHGASMGHGPMEEGRTTQHLGLILLIHVPLLRNHWRSSVPWIHSLKMRPLLSFTQSFIHSPQIFTDHLLFTSKCYFLWKRSHLSPPSPPLRPRLILAHTCACMHMQTHMHTLMPVHNTQAFQPLFHILLWLPQSGLLVLPYNPIAPEFPLSKHFLTVCWNHSFISLSSILNVTSVMAKTASVLFTSGRFRTHHSAWYTQGPDIQ